MQKIILDTDIGDDIDDALALAFILKSPELDLIGISTVYKNTKLRTKQALSLLEAYERNDIPVATGVGKPFFEKVDVNEVPCQWSETYADTVYNCDIHGVDLILQLIKENPEAKLVGIGPLTNIATAIIKEPETMKNVELVLMAGMYLSHYSEWNIACDPVASRIVFESGLRITMVGLDVTLHCKLDQKDVSDIKGVVDKGSNLLSEMMTKWEDEVTHLPILHDPLTIAYLTHPHLLTLEKKQLHIECNGEFTRGMTVDQKDVFYERPLKESNVTVATNVDYKNFNKLFKKRVFGIN